MPKPITPLVGCDVFVVDPRRRVLLIRRRDNNLWALPGGCQDLGETPTECAVRECYEETGFRIRVTRLLGVFSSKRYKFVHYPWKENEFTHLLYAADIEGGEAKNSSETSEVAFFSANDLPALSDGHDVRIKFGWQWLKETHLAPHFE